MKIVSTMGTILAAIIVASIIGANNQINANTRDIAVCKSDAANYTRLLMEVRHDVKILLSKVK